MIRCVGSTKVQRLRGRRVWSVRGSRFKVRTEAIENGSLLELGGQYA